MAVSKLTNKMTLEEFIASRVRDRDSMRDAVRRMDALRKRFGKPEKGFNSVEVLRKLRDAR